MVTNESLLTASAVLDRLVAVGAREFFFAPGSRSAPFVYTACERDGTDLRTHVRLDERSAAFHALGAARATGLPAVVVTTSGTAVGNLLPAVLEADHAQVPLVLLTADRPPELRGTGANQTTRQPGIFGDHVRAAVDVVLPHGIDATQIPTAVHQVLGPVLPALSGDREPVGPVHVNVSLREPLQPEPPDDAWQPSGQLPRQSKNPWPSGPVNPIHAVDLGEQDLVMLRHARRDLARHRSVILAGDGAGRAAQVLAEHLDLPLFAEPSSGARHGRQAVGPYRLLLGSQAGRGIERVLLIGRPTLSRPVGELLARPEVLTAAWQPRPVAWYDEGRRRETVLRGLAEVLEFTGVGPSDWAGSWHQLGTRAEHVLGQELEQALARRETGEAAQTDQTSGRGGEEPPTMPGPVLAREVWRACAKDGRMLVAGSSNPIRDLDLAASPVLADDATGAGAVTVLANRGLAGIDGTVATAAGAALATGHPTCVLVGDLTFLHDAGSLLRLTAEAQPDLQVVILDDRGGGIFSTLEHGALGAHPRWSAHVERFFGTEPQVNIPALCRAYGVPVREVSGVGELRDALGQRPRGVSVVVVAATRADLRELHARLRTRLAEL